MSTESIEESDIDWRNKYFKEILSRSLREKETEKLSKNIILLVVVFLMLLSVLYMLIIAP